MLKNNVKYIGFVALSTAALIWLTNEGIAPIDNPMRPGEYMIDSSEHHQNIIDKFLERPDVIVAMTWIFALSGSTITLPSDFNPGSNQINAIGAGVGGGAGGNGSPCCPTGGTGGGCPSAGGGGGVC